jgi:hypothetical protein
MQHREYCLGQPNVGGTYLSAHKGHISEGLGTVKWSNVKMVIMNATKEDYFVHQVAIQENNTRKHLHSR